MTLKKILFLSFIIFIIALSTAIYRGHSIGEKIKELSLHSDDLQPIEKEDFTQLNDIYTESTLEAQEVAPQEENSVAVQTQYCLEGDTTQKEQDLVKLNQLENEIYVKQNLSISEVQTIRAKILAIKNTYNLPLDYIDQIRMEDFIAIEMSEYSANEYKKLSDTKKRSLITQLGGTKFLRDTYLKSEILGNEAETFPDQSRSSASLTQEQLEKINEQQLEIEYNYLLEHNDDF